MRGSYARMQQFRLSVSRGKYNITKALIQQTNVMLRVLIMLSSPHIVTKEIMILMNRFMARGKYCIQAYLSIIQQKLLEDRMQVICYSFGG